MIQVPFNLWINPSFKKNLNLENQYKAFLLNFGPQHPASHGVLRLLLKLNGELILTSDSNIGFLHRGTEKLIENRHYLKSLPYFDRLDYVSMMTQEHAYCLTIENLLTTLSFSNFFIKIRVLFDELTRLLNHFLGISTHSLDVGNMSPAFWAFEEREKIMEYYERVSGARMHAAFYRPNELDLSGFNYQFFLDIFFFSRNSYKSIIEMYTILATNNIWKSRLIKVGSVPFNNGLDFGISGVVARSAGLKKDLRVFKYTTYSYYWYLSFRTFLGKMGDCYDRFIIRIREMFESFYIIFQLLPYFLDFFSTSDFEHLKFNLTSNLNLFKNNFKKINSMEAIINHFKTYSEGIKLPAGITYASVEAPKGEFGVTLISNNSNLPFRSKIRTPAYHHLNLMSYQMEGHYLADMITILGSQDIVFGEVDR